MGHQLLNGKRGIIFGVVNELSLAYFVAKQCLDEGALLVLTNTEKSIELGQVKDIAASWNVPLIACDATKEEDITNLYSQAEQLLGGKIDFILHAVAMSQNLRRRKEYDNLSYNYFQQTIDISALSLHRCLQIAKKMDILSNGASVVTLTYIAANKFSYGYNDMADAKAMLESIVRNFGGIYGEEKGVRINAISQSPTPTKASGQYNQIDDYAKYADLIAPLGNATAQSCAELCVMLFSDYTRFLTMQTIYNDGGFCNSILTKKLINNIEFKK